MRIALACPYDLAVDGGVRGQVIGLARALGEAGEEVCVLGPGTLARRRGGPPGDAGPPGRVELVRLGASLRVAANGSLAPVALGPFVPARVARALRRFAPDVVHVHEPFAPLVGLAAAHPREAPVLATFHRAGAGPGYRLAGLALRHLFDRLDGASAVSESARATLAEVIGERARAVEVIPNGIDLERFAAPGAVDAEPAAGGRRPTVVFVGRIEPRKGLGVLLEAAASSEASADVLVIGEGPERARLEARHGAGGAIRFLGRLDDAELARRLASADLFVAPSLGGESFGVVLLEAMAAGTPVVAADLPGYHEAAGGAARYVAPGDVLALRRALEELLAAPSERRRLAELGRARVAGFGFRQQAARYLERYRALLERRHADRRGT